jgi:hypothetical protein
MKGTTSRFVYWTPRILSILFLIFLAMFSLDVFGTGLGFWKTILALLIHNIPVFILTIVLIISWKYEIVGGVAFILAGILYVVIMLFNVFNNKFEWYMVSYSLIIGGPAFVIGGLFLANWYKKKK